MSIVYNYERKPFVDSFRNFLIIQMLYETNFILFKYLLFQNNILGVKINANITLPTQQ